MLALTVVLVFAIAGADPVLKLFTWLTNLGALGVLLLMAATSFAVVGYFRQRPEAGLSAWSSRIAPALAGVLLLVILVLGVLNFNVLITSATDAPTDKMTIILPLILFGGGALGPARGRAAEVAQAGDLRRDRGGPRVGSVRHGEGRVDVSSVPDRVYAILRERILAGELEPESRLHQEGISAELGVSRTPVREAIARLAAEGLVELLANRGARVAAVRPGDMEAAYVARLGIEPLAARLAAARRDPAELTQAAQDAHARARGREGRLRRLARLPPRARAGVRQPASWSTSPRRCGPAGSACMSTRSR